MYYSAEKGKKVLGSRYYGSLFAKAAVYILVGPATIRSYILELCIRNFAVSIILITNYILINIMKEKIIILTLFYYFAVKNIIHFIF